MERGLVPILRGNPAVYRTWRIACPAIAERCFAMLVTMIDTKMVSGLGTAAIAAVAITTQPRLIYLAPFEAVSLVVSIMVSQSIGAKQNGQARQAVSLGIWVCLLSAILATAACVLLADEVLLLTGADSVILESAAAYFRILMVGHLFHVESLLINASLRGAGMTKSVFYSGLAANLTNVCFNYILIEGRCGFPRLEVAGAALASLLGMAVGLAVSAAFLMKEDCVLNLRRKTEVQMTAVWRPMLSLSWNTLQENLFKRIGMFLYGLMVAKIGIAALAAHQIGVNFTNLSFAIGDGIANAACTLVGQSAGADSSEDVQRYGGICHMFGTGIGSAIAGIYILFARQLFGLFVPEEEVLRYAEPLMTITAMEAFLEIVQVTTAGCLRGLGDLQAVTRISFVSITLIRPVPSVFAVRRKHLYAAFAAELVWGRFPV